MGARAGEGVRGDGQGMGRTCLQVCAKHTLQFPHGHGGKGRWGWGSGSMGLGARVGGVGVRAGWGGGKGRLGSGQGPVWVVGVESHRITS